MKASKISAVGGLNGDKNKPLSKKTIDEINQISKFNAKKREIESIAKKDSISGATKAKLIGKDIIDQGRAGNAAANVTRVKLGNPQVTQGRKISYTSYPAPDKYTNPLDIGGTGTSDIYTRTKQLEKDMPRVKKS